MDKNLLKQFLQKYPSQPATAFWRSIEIGQVIHSFPDGFGLDLGCGDGKLTQIILERVGKRELVGIDIDPKETAQATGSGIYKRVHTKPGDNIPEADETFDFVFSNSVLEHIDNIKGVIREVARLLKVGGIFLFTVPGDKFHQCLRGPNLPWVSRQAYLNDLDARCAHQRYWSVEDWRNNLLIHNLEIENVTEYLNKHEVQRWENLARFTSGILYNLFGKNKHPIEIQRSLGLRSAKTELPSSLASFFSTLATFNLISNGDEEKKLKGCLMIQAQKR